MQSKALLLIALFANAAAMAACSSDATPTPAATPTPGAMKEGGVSSDIVNLTHQDLVVNVGTAIT